METGWLPAGVLSRIRRSSRRSSNWPSDRRSNLSSAINTSSTVSRPGGSFPCLRIRSSALRAGWLRLWVFALVGFYGMFSRNAILAAFQVVVFLIALEGLSWRPTGVYSLQSVGQ